MKLLIIAATFFEIRPFADRLTLAGREGDHLYRYRHHNLEIDILITGVGMVATAYYTGKALALKRYDLAVNAGIAGTFGKAFKLGSVVNVVEDWIPEFGAENGRDFISIFELGFYDPDTHPFTQGMLQATREPDPAIVNLQRLNLLPRVKGITSNTIRGSVESVEYIRRTAPADIESMEGAAFLFSCLMEKTPCIQLRSVSNLVEERDKAKWDLPLALKNLNQVLWQLFIEKNQ
jgi:futalosine hydrolase